MKILLVEDDELLCAALTKLLEANRYTLDQSHDGQAGLEMATVVDYDLILLDVQMPKLDGIQLCRQLRAQGYRKPILLITANCSDADAIAGFEAGADDYISKPYASEVLLARIRTLLRRSGVANANAGSNFAAHQTLDQNLHWGALCLDPDTGQVTVDEQIIALTATEYHLLELFLRNPQRIFSRSAILDKLWGFNDAPSDRAIVTHIKDLRKRLKAGGLTEDLLETVYGMGYRLKSPPASNSLENHKAQENHKDQRQPVVKEKSAVDRVLEKCRDIFNEQIAVLAQAKTALLTKHLEAALRQAAQQEAHKLAGSLASFGYPEGSKLARSLEYLLTHNSFTPEAISQYTEQVTALQQVLAQPPVSQKTAQVAIAPAGRVLMIDDDVALTEQLKAGAAARKMQIEVASTIAEARSRLAQMTPDVVLLDLSFPDVAEDGLSLLKEISQRAPSGATAPDLPVIVFTGRDRLADRLTVSRLGAKQFLQKPATPEQIFQAIERVLLSSEPSAARVLMVDDDPTVLALLSTMLTLWGVDVTTLNEPDRFWEVLVETSPHLVLLDLEMPEVNGLELCQVIRQDAQWGNLPVLVVTAHTEADSLQQAFAAGADDFITKPVLGPELITRVLSRIERTQLQQKLQAKPEGDKPHSRQEQ